MVNHFEDIRAVRVQQMYCMAMPIRNLVRNNICPEIYRFR